MVQHEAQDDGGGFIPRETREALLLDAARARERALEKERRGEWGAAAGELSSAGRKLRECGIEDERLEEEADDLERMSERVAARGVNEADRKYLYQRAHDSSRGRAAAYRKISRRRDRR